MSLPHYRIRHHSPRPSGARVPHGQSRTSVWLILLAFVITCASSSLAVQPPRDGPPSKQGSAGAETAPPPATSAARGGPPGATSSSSAPTAPDRQTPQPEAGTHQVDTLLTLTQVILGLVGIVLVFLSIGGAMFGLYLNQHVVRIEHKVESFEGNLPKQLADNKTEALREIQKELNDFRKEHERWTEEALSSQKRVIELFDVANSTLITSADFALVNLPAITFSQQVPTHVVRSLRSLHRTFIEGTEGAKLLQDLDQQRNVRIRYALALHRLGSNHLQSDQDRARSIELLAEAEGCCNDVVLSRDLSIRIFQLHRQGREYDDARRKCLDRLGPSKDEYGRLLWYWGSTVLSLQMGLAERAAPDRVAHFEAAANVAAALCSRQDLLDAARRRQAGAVFYYCAKAFWAYRFASALASEDRFCELFWWSALMARKTLQEAIDQGTGDGAVDAIYLASLAYVMLACRAYPRGDRDEQFKASRKATGEEFIDLDKACADVNFVRDRLRLAEELLTDPSLEDIVIYNDHEERLTTILEFFRYVRELRVFNDDPTKIWPFYATGSMA